MILHNHYVSQIRRSAHEGKMVELTDGAPTLTACRNRSSSRNCVNSNQPSCRYRERATERCLLVGLTRANYIQIPLPHVI
jgi:hypothetical protein